MISRVIRPGLANLLVVVVASFAVVAGYQLGGGEIPYAPAIPTVFLYSVAAGLVGVGVIATLLAHPEFIGRAAPTIYVLVALLPQLWIDVPAIEIIRFIPLALIAPVALALYRSSPLVRSQTRLARVAVFAAVATSVTSLIANFASTDYMRLLLMVSGIVLLVGVAPRSWSNSWRNAASAAVSRSFWAIALSSIALLPISDSFQGDRLQGPFDSPNTLGALLALTTPISSSRARFPALNWTLGFALSIASGSRGGLLALTVAAVVLLIQKRRFVPLAALATMGTLVVMSGVVRTTASHQETFGVNTRALIWDEVSDAVLESPLTGHGFGAVDDFEFTLETQRWVGRSPQTHSSWLDVAYEQGILGLLLWSAVLALGASLSVRAGPVWAATVLAGLVSATFESWLFAIGGGIGSLFWLVIGAASTAPAQAPVRHRPTSHENSRWRPSEPEQRSTSFHLEIPGGLQALERMFRRGRS